MNGDQPFLVKTDVNENPWEVLSLYQFQFFICPQCVFQISSKQGFVNHVHDFHIEAEEFLQKIEDDSLLDIFCPWAPKDSTIKNEPLESLDIDFEMKNSPESIDDNNDEEFVPEDNNSDHSNEEEEGSEDDEAEDDDREDKNKDD